MWLYCVYFKLKAKKIATYCDFIRKNVEKEELTEIRSIWILQKWKYIFDCALDFNIKLTKIS